MRAISKKSLTRWSNRVWNPGGLLTKYCLIRSIKVQEVTMYKRVTKMIANIFEITANGELS